MNGKAASFSAVAFFASLILIFNEMTIFGRLETVTSHVRTNTPIVLEKYLIAPSKCHVSIGGWVADSQGLGSDVDVKFGKYFHSLNGSEKPIQFISLDNNELRFKTESSGSLLVRLEQIEDPGSVYEDFSVNLDCINSVSWSVGVLSSLTLFFSFLYLIAYGMRSLFRVMSRFYFWKRDKR